MYIVIATNENGNSDSITRGKGTLHQFGVVDNNTKRVMTMTITKGDDGGQWYQSTIEKGKTAQWVD